MAGLGSVTLQFVGQRGQRVHIAQGRSDGRRQHRNRPIEPRVEAEVTPERVDVAVEDCTDDISMGVDERRAGVTADDVIVGRHVERRLGIEVGLGVEPALRQTERLDTYTLNRARASFSCARVMGP